MRYVAGGAVRCSALRADACRAGGNLLEPGSGQDVRRNSFAFDRVFGPDSRQEDVFADLQPVVQSCLDGYNVCVFAYGQVRAMFLLASFADSWAVAERPSTPQSCAQTRSGKTYTLQGSTAAPGVTTQSLRYLFSAAASATAPYDTFAVSLSMLEVYNDAVFDLLSPSREDVQVCLAAPQFEQRTLSHLSASAASV